MSDQIDLDLRTRAKPRVIKAPAIRKAELIDCAQRLFLLKGYEKTTINDVIEATALSKGAFYHHFRAKEDLLEAIAARFAEQSLGHASAVRNDASLNALEALNRLLAMSREWKSEHMPQLRAMFATLLRPENSVLYNRIVSAVFAALTPAVADIIAAGQREDLFDVTDPDIAAEALLSLSEGRRVLIVTAMTVAESGDVEAAVRMIMRRLRAEEAIVDRILGLPPGGVQLAGPEAEMRALIVAWVEAQEAVSP